MFTKIRFFPTLHALKVTISQTAPVTMKAAEIQAASTIEFFATPGCAPKSVASAALTFFPEMPATLRDALYTHLRIQTLTKYRARAERIHQMTTSTAAEENVLLSEALNLDSKGNLQQKALALKIKEFAIVAPPYKKR
tara:strand:+ start:12 stop:425 length:414 start_codon:yes stop_codon:yes gene_type:complete